MSIPQIIDDIESGPSTVVEKLAEDNNEGNGIVQDMEKSSDHVIKEEHFKCNSSSNLGLERTLDNVDGPGKYDEQEIERTQALPAGCGQDGTSNNEVEEEVQVIIDFGPEQDGSALHSHTQIDIASDVIGETLSAAIDYAMEVVRTREEASIPQVAIEVVRTREEASIPQVAIEVVRAERAAELALPGTAPVDEQPINEPPSYTSVEIRQPSLPYVAQVPPPSYGEVMGIEHLTSPRPHQLILNVGRPPGRVWTHRSQPAYCRNCHVVVISKIRHKACTFTHVVAGLLFFLLCWPFCVLPYCLNYCKQAKHYCPGCNAVLGSYSPII